MESICDKIRVRSTHHIRRFSEASFVGDFPARRDLGQQFAALPARSQAVKLLAVQLLRLFSRHPLLLVPGVPLGACLELDGPGLGALDVTDRCLLEQRIKLQLGIVGRLNSGGMPDVVDSLYKACVGHCEKKKPSPNHRPCGFSLRPSPNHRPSGAF